MADVTIEEGNAIARDVVRWRKLERLLQACYDSGRPHMELEFESGRVAFVECTGIGYRKGVRTVQAVIQWKDESDEPLAFGAALDAMDLDAVLAEVAP